MQTSTFTKAHGSLSTRHPPFHHFPGSGLLQISDVNRLSHTTTAPQITAPFTCFLVNWRPMEKNFHIRGDSCTLELMSSLHNRCLFHMNDSSPAGKMLLLCQGQVRCQWIINATVQNKGLMALLSFRLRWSEMSLEAVITIRCIVYSLAWQL